MINEAFVHFDVLQNAVTKLKSNYEVRIICEKLEVSNKVAKHLRTLPTNTEVFLRGL